MKKKLEHKVVKIDRAKLKRRGSSKVIDAADKVVDAKTGEVLKDRRVALQGTLPAPGMAPKAHPDIVEAGNELALAREKAKSATKFAKLKESVVIAKMKHHGETRYVDRGQNIEITLKLSETIGLKQFDHNDDDGDKLA